MRYSGVSATSSRSPLSCIEPVITPSGQRKRPSSVTDPPEVVPRPSKRELVAFEATGEPRIREDEVGAVELEPPVAHRETRR